MHAQANHLPLAYALKLDPPRHTFPLMTATTIISLLIGLAALTAFSLYRHNQPIEFGKPRIIPWVPIGMFAAACDLMVIAYAFSYFSN